MLVLILGVAVATLFLIKNPLVALLIYTALLSLVQFMMLGLFW